MPNWKNPAEYEFEFPDHLKDRGWAWEFLRRNHRYRAEWHDLYESVGPLISKYGPFTEWLEKSAELKAESGAWVPHHLYGTWELLPVAMGRSWYLQCMADPDASGASDVKFLDLPDQPPTWGKAWDVRPFIGGMEEVVPKGVYTWIRLDAHIEPQLELLRKTLKQLQKDQNIDLPHPPDTKRRNDKYKGYIRVLDGLAAGASPHEIALALGLEDKYPERAGSHTIRDWLKVANKMVNGGYISLASK
jgi:hypothetical protein